MVHHRDGLDRRYKSMKTDELLVMLPSNFQLVINLETAKIE